MTLEWLIPFGTAKNSRIAHLIDVSSVLTRRLCRGDIVNRELARTARGMRHCAICKAIAARKA